MSHDGITQGLAWLVFIPSVSGAGELSQLCFCVNETESD